MATRRKKTADPDPSAAALHGGDPAASDAAESSASKGIYQDLPNAIMEHRG
ncbi:hypothetical protein [Cupriavidus sp. D384]|uniref:hypothetical protein n=1 Tax=Cupriavidus sp. D384 TaxID=1538095 RepID=UPI000ACE0285|nr:hypothetical protein [Cupriavidus sp. D384]